MSTPPPETVRRRRNLRPGRRALLIGIGLIVCSVILFAPNLAVLLLHRQILGWASKQIDGQLSASSLSCGWLQPTVMYHPAATDDQGQQVLAAEQVQLDKSLLKLLLSPNDLGLIRVVRPQVNLVTWHGGSNVEELLAPIMEQPAGDKPLSVAWEISDGEITIQSQQSAGGSPSSPVVWQIERLAGSLQKASETTVTLETQMSLLAGALQGDLQATTKTRGAANDIDLVARNVPLQAFEPLLARVMAGATLQGTLDGKVHLHLDPQTQQGALEPVDITLTNLHLHADTLLAGRPMSLRVTTLRGVARWDAKQVQCEQLELLTDIGSLRGSALAQLPQGTLLEQVSQMLATSRVALDAQVDLAAVSQAAPGLLRLREDVSIQSGNVQLSLSSQPEADQSSWKATLATTNIHAIRAGQPFQWNDPLQATLSARWINNSLDVQQLECRSDFLTATLEGTPARGQITVTGSIERLVNRVGQFVALNGIQAAGQLSGQTRWQKAQQRWDIDGHMSVDEFVWTLPQRPPWREPQLNLQYTLAADLDASGNIAQLHTAVAELTAPGERVHVELAAPVAGPMAGATWPLTATISSKLQRWARRLNPVPASGGPAWQPSGIVDVRLQATVAGQDVRLESLQGNIEDFRLQGPTIDIVEPQVVLQLAGSWQASTQTCSVEKLTLQSTALSVGSPGFRAQLTAGAPVLDGELALSSDLMRLQKWLPQTAVPPTTRLSGELTGNAVFNSSQQSTALQWNVDIERFALATRSLDAAGVNKKPAEAWDNLWQDPKLSSTGKGELNSATGRLSLADVKVAGRGIALSGQGTLDDLAGSMVVDFTGQLSYDLKQLTGRLRRLAVQQLTLQGQRQEAIVVRGPLRSLTVTSGTSADAAAATGLVPAELTAQGALSWDSVDAMGIVIGQGKLAAELKNQQLQFSLLDVPVSGGKLTARPHIDLSHAPGQLRLPAGPLLQDVQISAELCRSWLQFVAPLVANATSADGKFGLQLDRFAMPLGDAQQSDVAGALVIQEARIGPGPLAQNVLSVAERILAIVDRKIPGLTNNPTSRWAYLPAQVVAFEVQNGRVVHREFQMRVGDVQLLTRGWVGMDQTMSLTLEIPVRDEWAERNRLFEGFRGKSITIPIEGTLSRPQLDDRILSELGKQALGSAAGGLLRELLQRRQE